MKFVKILAAVAALHAAAIALFLVTPGCQSTSGTGPGAGAPLASSETLYSGASDSSLMTPIPLDASSSDLAAADLNPGVASSFPASPPASGSGRFSPTRPDAAVSLSAPPPPVETAPSVTYEVKRGDSLWSLARRHGLTVPELARANGLNTSNPLHPGQKLLIPGKPAESSATAGSGPLEGSTSYQVRSGDSLSSIAKRHGTTVGAIRTLNEMRGDMIRVGQTLLLPAGSTQAVATTAEAASSRAAPRPAGAVTHVVRPGETLGGIARKYQVSVGDLATANNISDPRLLRSGQELVVPGFQAVPPAPSAPVVVQPQPEARPAPAQPEPLPYGPLPPPPSEDLDAGLPADVMEAPVIRVEESGAPRIE